MIFYCYYYHKINTQTIIVGLYKKDKLFKDI